VQIAHGWPKEETYELKSRMTRSLKSAFSQLSDKNCDGIIKKKFKGLNRSKGEVAETIHLLFMAKLRGYITEKTYMGFRIRLIECLQQVGKNSLKKKACFNQHAFFNNLL
jgi:four helix bundle protein